MVYPAASMSLHDGPHVEIAFLVRRLLDNATDKQARRSARTWLAKHRPTLEEYEAAVVGGAKPLPFRLTPGQAHLLVRASRGDVKASHYERSAEALMVRGLLERTETGEIIPSAWGEIWLRSVKSRQEEPMDP